MQDIMDELMILLVEDDDNDVLFVTRALRKAGVNSPITHLRDGNEAINYLAGCAPCQGPGAHAMPSLILLDLQTPEFSGFSLLQWLRSQPELAHIPVIVLTDSINPNDRKLAQQFDVTGYAVKPLDFDQLVDIAFAVKLRLSHRTRPEG